MRISAPAWVREHPGPWLPAGEAPGTPSGTQPISLRYTSGLEAASHVALLLAFCLLHALLPLLPLLSRFSRVRVCVIPETAAHRAPLSLGFCRQEHWSGLPFPSPLYESEKWKGIRSVMLDSLHPHDLQPNRPLRPWDFPGKSTGVGCHRLLHTACITRPQISKWCYLDDSGTSDTRHKWNHNNALAFFSCTYQAKKIRPPFYAASDTY